MNPEIPEREVVLIVDDVPENLAVLSDALDDAGFMVLVATDGASALESLQRVSPHIILLDAVMPGMDGFETCRRIKAQASTRAIPVVFMTGLTETEHIVRGFEAGGIDYVTKPIHPDEVMARIRAHLNTARLISQARSAVDAAGIAIIVLDEQGRPAWQTRTAGELLKKFFGVMEGDPLPEHLLTWAQARPTESGPAESDEMSGKMPRSRIVGAERLSVHSLGRGGGAEPVLLLRVEPAQAGDDKLRVDFNLTAREVEVLSWIAKGKTNRDIAEILGMSHRTVNKHLEHIYTKLGVETRTAAAAFAISNLAAS
jgi:DNA-binding response OmpR family regulator/DNA-binding CsgD family transcriptional regulator